MSFSRRRSPLRPPTDDNSISPSRRRNSSPSPPRRPSKRQTSPPFSAREKRRRASAPNLPIAADFMFGIVHHGESTDASFMLPPNVNIIAYAYEQPLCYAPTFVWDALHKNIHSLRILVETLMQPEYRVIRRHFGLWEGGVEIPDIRLNIQPDENWRVGIFYRPHSSYRIIQRDYSERRSIPLHPDIMELPAEQPFRLSDFVAWAVSQENLRDHVINIVLWTCRSPNTLRLPIIPIYKTLIPYKYMEFNGMNVAITDENHFNVYSQDQIQASIEFLGNSYFLIYAYTPDVTKYKRALYALLCYIIDLTHSQHPNRPVFFRIHQVDVEMNPMATATATVLTLVGFTESYYEFQFQRESVVQNIVAIPRPPLDTSESESASAPASAPAPSFMSPLSLPPPVAVATLDERVLSARSPLLSPPPSSLTPTSEPRVLIPERNPIFSPPTRVSKRI